MLQIDDKFLDSLGLAELPDEDKKQMKQHIFETLEMRVGMNLASKMTEQQLAEFEKLMDAQDDAGALKWLETNFPNYKDVVAGELKKLQDEIKATAKDIVAASKKDA